MNTLLRSVAIALVTLTTLGFYIPAQADSLSPVPAPTNIEGLVTTEPGIDNGDDGPVPAPQGCIGDTVIEIAPGDYDCLIEEIPAVDDGEYVEEQPAPEVEPDVEPQPEPVQAEPEFVHVSDARELYLSSGAA